MYVHSGSIYIKIVLKDLKTKYVKSLKSKKTPVNPFEKIFLSLYVSYQVKQYQPFELCP